MHWQGPAGHIPPPVGLSLGVGCKVPAMHMMLATDTPRRFLGAVMTEMATIFQTFA